MRWFRFIVANDVALAIFGHVPSPVECEPRLLSLLLLWLPSQALQLKWISVEWDFTGFERFALTHSHRAFVSSCVNSMSWIYQIQTLWFSWQNPTISLPLVCAPSTLNWFLSVFKHQSNNFHGQTIWHTYEKQQLFFACKSVFLIKFQLKLMRCASARTSLTFGCLILWMNHRRDK